MYYIYLFFFFQAEAGIRDYKVTGVQTCALPICCTVASSPANPAEWRTCSTDAPSRSVSLAAASADNVPESKRLPKHPMPKRVGSSEVNTSNSMECFGRKPERRNARMASRPPNTPTMPSYLPALGMASMCEPVPTTGAAGSEPLQRAKTL